MLCISPVAALSGDDFSIVKWKADKVEYFGYICERTPHDEYIHIFPSGTSVLNSLVTFKPANIPDAPEMVIDTSGVCIDASGRHPSKMIKLCSCVGEWEIKYYSRFWSKLDKPDPEYLKNSGVIHLNWYFRDAIRKGSWLELQISAGQYITDSWGLRWSIPSV